jgi:hypothetical protein
MVQHRRRQNQIVRKPRQRVLVAHRPPRRGRPGNRLRVRLQQVVRVEEPVQPITIREGVVNLQVGLYWFESEDPRPTDR